MDLARLLAQIDDTLLGELFSANALSRARAYVALLDAGGFSLDSGRDARG